MNNDVQYFRKRLLLLRMCLMIEFFRIRKTSSLNKQLTGEFFAGSVGYTRQTIILQTAVVLPVVIFMATACGNQACICWVGGDLEKQLKQQINIGVIC